ncbi:hypothetical protein GE09DRAFT_1211595 [Coniochaeta sp. 2T2.1]|nr:hypothetical protein GE09DRAFT_1211595 [Coniochaeta sp. 2T2.1]
MTALYPAETNSGVVTSWIPLTATFTPQESCTSQFPPQRSESLGTHSTTASKGSIAGDCLSGVDKGEVLTYASTPANPSSDPVPSTGLSSGAAVGIGVGVALGVIGIVALLVSVYLMRRRKQAAARAELEQQPPPPSVPPREEPKPWGSTHEVHELHPDGVKPELWTYRPPAELYGG